MKTLQTIEVVVLKYVAKQNKTLSSEKRQKEMSTNLYEQQLVQIRQALESCESEEDRANLISLQKDLEEIISLENLENENSDETLEESFQESKKVKLLISINKICKHLNFLDIASAPD